MWSCFWAEDALSLEMFAGLIAAMVLVSASSLGSSMVVARSKEEVPRNSEGACEAPMTVDMGPPCVVDNGSMS